MKSLFIGLFVVGCIVGVIAGGVCGMLALDDYRDSTTETTSSAYGILDYYYEKYPEVQQDIKDALKDDFLSRKEYYYISDKIEIIDLVKEKAELKAFLESQ